MRQDAPNDAYTMRDGENWKQFCGVCLNPKPEWEGKKMCARWHTRGFYLLNCNNKISHVNSENVSAEKDKEYRTWLGTVRATF